MAVNKPEIEIIKTLLRRLERISVDSHWSHRANGVRGALLKALQIYEQGNSYNDVEIQLLISSSFDLLLKAVKKE